MHLFNQPEIAIETTKTKIIFYKRHKTFMYNTDTIDKVLINTGWGSFDIYVYVKDSRRKGFHYLIVNSTIKKKEFTTYFKFKNIEVVEYDFTGI